MPDDRVPPSNAARITLFLGLVQTYRVLCAALPVEQGEFVIGGPPRDPSDRWHRLLRAFALRKFATPSDQVSLTEVTKSLNALLPVGQTDPVNPDDVDALVGQLKSGTGAFGVGPTEHIDANAVVEDLLYGQYLHGDYGRWVRSQGKQHVYEDHALWEWTAGLEDLVFEFERLILQLKGSGEIRLD